MNAETAKAEMAKAEMAKAEMAVTEVEATEMEGWINSVNNSQSGGKQVKWSPVSKLHEEAL
jgi:hypothetical protein